jgi:hypothetical protein
MSDFFDRDGKPITLSEYIVLAGRDNYVRVAGTDTGEAWISTVWLGRNHHHDPDMPPLIFETTIFSTTGDPYQERYSTEAEARAGHQRAVEHARRLKGEPA